MRDERVEDRDADEELEFRVKGFDPEEWQLSNIDCFDRGFELEEEPKWDNDDEDDFRDDEALDVFVEGHILAVASGFVGLVVERDEDSGGFKSLADIPTKIVSKQGYSRGIDNRGRPTK